MIPFALVLLCGCATTAPRLVTGEATSISQREIAVVLRENALAQGQDSRITLLRQSEHASVHLVQVRGAEKAHFHKTHDLTVFMVRGSGVMKIGPGTRWIRRGDVVHVPAGVLHYFTNGGSSPAIAVIVFSPPFDGKDTVTVE